MLACKTMNIIKIAMALLFAVCAIVGKVQAENVNNIILISHHTAPYKEVFAGFQKFLNQQGVKVNCDEYILESDKSKTREIIQQIKGRKANLLFTVGNKATEIVLNDISDTPVVASMILKNTKLTNAKNVTGVMLEISLKTE